MRSRRTFLGLLGSSAVVAVMPVPALADDGTYDISYLWVRELDALLDYREIVGDALGPKVARDLIVVRGGSGNWGLMLDTSETSERAAKQLAAAHHQLLVAQIGGKEVLATVLPDRGYSRTYHVRYGMFETSREAREAFATIARRLGPEVEHMLFVEQVFARKWHVVYKRFGDKVNTRRIAAAQEAVLDGTGIRANAIPDQYREARWAAHSAESVAMDEADEADAAELLAGASEADAVSLVDVTDADHREGVFPPHPRRGRSVTRRRPAEVRPVALAADEDARPRIPPTPDPPPAARTPAPAPAPVRDELPASIATPLRNAINEYIQKLRRTRVLQADERTSWYVHTLHDNRTWAAINAEVPLQCASMVKPYVALAFLHRAKEGRIIYGRKSRSQLEEMIQHSSNDATNWAMKTVGGPAGVQSILSRSYGHIFRETSIAEYIPKNGRTYRNRSSARDYVRFSRALWQDQLPYSAEIRRIMALPGRDRLATGAPAIPASTKVMNKTGTTSHLCGDFGILVAHAEDGTEVPYAIAGIIEKRNRASSFASWTASRARIIRGVSNLVYLELGKHYALGGATG